MKSWHWRFYWHGSRARLVLGLWPKTSLAEAHEKTEAARGLLRRGIDPRRAGITSASRVRPEAAPAEGPPQHSVALDRPRARSDSVIDTDRRNRSGAEHAGYRANHGRHRCTIHRWVCAGTFPPKRAGGGGGWLRSDIECWLNGAG